MRIVSDVPRERSIRACALYLCASAVLWLNAYLGGTWPLLIIGLALFWAGHVWGDKVYWARRLATIRHAGQLYHGHTPPSPYINHVRNVVDWTILLHGGFFRHLFQNRDAIAVAWLHDLLEDTNTTDDEIYECFGEKIADAVWALTRVEGQKYHDYIIDKVALNPLAMKVKIADLNSNLSAHPTESLRSRYEWALEHLTRLTDLTEGGK